ncbi:hypothetical protein DKZ29_06205 [Limosilactobacillus reuteri]|uniref:Uncharacterized protein n=1 Tax=Limosilactobacillus reuteri TaxID=1598 RepID=A0ABD6Y7G5_LIMRT|nr:hypothetical protein [Limosilactobacillus reuteri]PWT35128.1 hypothetical protein DKZ24_05340 [Limosilactobacillus reuteri]PWT37686.1 hypothetical protein DKZ35_04200 [Limosilactobacillus reuteri]PWT58280.1 hypothetical protein DKZ29_06205 [Limosilactobacillus reuteri]PWT59928.1 hypothetical protein DKZ30_04585 [Limosilactobacillus reuteri]PWT66574.1 hypothetical protein DKZ28_05050 [Limosilactobacillus reuteri]
MSLKNYTFRYDPESDIGQWLNNQNNKTESLNAVIRTVIANFGNDDYLKAVLSQVNLNGNNRPIVQAEKVIDKHIEEPRVEATEQSKPVQEEIENDKKEENNESNNKLDMFSSL